ncbi:MAG: gamma-glutamylcyclotransferase [Gemmatimonadaceae bacterium]|nr:gamma-glutamylcyclotransferase [Gemmatimonadaceae bacterium]
MTLSPLSLFVYGTLREDDTHEMYRVLARAGRFVGDGWVAGELYDLGDYPGMVASELSHSRVSGELYELRPESAESSLATLDDFEGLAPSDPAPRDYSRRLVAVHLAGGATTLAWAYILTRPTEGLTRIASGDYLAWRRSRRGA